MCGRDDELSLLRDALARAVAGQGGVVFITGEPGIGKSRLVRELISDARRRGALTATGRAVPAGSGTPYRPLTEALLQILRDRPLPADGELAPWLAALQAILPGIGPADLQAAGPREHAASPVARGEAVIRLIRWLGVGAGLVVALEDLHWADPDTLTVLEYLADNVGGERVLVLATSRDEPASAGAGLARRLAARRAATHIPLDRLDADAVEQMVRACVTGAGDQLVIRAQLAADGVPFLVEEVLASPGVPESFAEMVRARLAGFGPGERRVLDAAALLGRSFDWQPLADTSSCELAHTGYVISGRLRVRMNDGTEAEFGPGDAHYVSPGHDAWVVGDEPLAVVDFTAPAQLADGGSRVSCPGCGVEFRIERGGQLDHLIAAVQQHASGSHGHDLTREHILSELQLA